MQPYLLLLVLGPVQDFIATARKCQDLWYGSHLLSQLAAAAAEGIESAAGDKSLVFPGTLGRDGSGASNKIVAQLPAGTDPASVAAAAKARMEERLAKTRDAAFDRLSGAGDFFERSVADAQVAELIEFIWVAVPIATTYREALTQAEALMAARKNSRRWQAEHHSRAGVPRSTLDPSRDSVIAESAYDRLKPAELRRKLYVKSRERIDGISLMKRIGTESAGQGTPAFHSTAHIASAPFRERLARLPAAQAAAQSLLSTLEEVGVDLSTLTIRAGGSTTWSTPDKVQVPRAFPRDGRGAAERGIDGTIFYANRVEELLDEHAAEGSNTPANRAAVERAISAVRAAAGAEPGPYYAMLLADGDRMGAAIERIAAADEHRALSKTLSKEFAARCAPLVEAAGGSLVYAGGDDVLALVPLHTAVTLADQLRRLFAAAMLPYGSNGSGPTLSDGSSGSGPALSDGSNGSGPTLSDGSNGSGPALSDGSNGSGPTLSVGIAIAHHLEPMGEVLELARQAEKLAKQRRNAIAIIVSPRSGEEKIVTAEWDETLGERTLVARLQFWAEQFGSGALPDGVIQHLRDAVAPLFVTRHAAEKIELADVARALVLRVLQRRELDESTKAQLMQAAGSYLLSEHQDPMRAVNRLADELAIARKLGQSVACARHLDSGSHE
jgi:CRISPR-associated protein Cmr2